MGLGVQVSPMFLFWKRLGFHSPDTGLHFPAVLLCYRALHSHLSSIDLSISYGRGETLAHVVEERPRERKWGEYV